MRRQQVPQQDQQEVREAGPLVDLRARQKQMSGSVGCAGSSSRSKISRKSAKRSRSWICARADNPSGVEAVGGCQCLSCRSSGGYHEYYHLFVAEAMISAMHALQLELPSTLFIQGKYCMTRLLPSSTKTSRLSRPADHTMLICVCSHPAAKE